MEDGMKKSQSRQIVKDTCSAPSMNDAIDTAAGASESGSLRRASGTPLQ